MSPIFTPDGQSVGNIDVATDNAVVNQPSGQVCWCNDPKNRIFAANWSRRIDLPHETVLRGGYGRSYYMNADGAGFGTQGCCWPIKQSQTDVRPIPSPHWATRSIRARAPAPLPPFPANGMISFFGAPGGSEYFVGVGNYPHSYNDTYNVTLEHAFPYQITASIAYVGNIGRHLWDNV